MKTYVYKLYRSKKNKELHKKINIAGIIYNHCIALHKRYYRLFGKSLNLYRLQKHITKLKKMVRYTFWKEVGSQAIQDITERIDKAYKLFYSNLARKVRTAPPKFKKVAKYHSFSLKQAGYKYVGNNVITIQGRQYKFSKSREPDGRIKRITVKRDGLGDIYVCFICEVEENEVLARTGKSVGFDFGFKKFLTSSDGNDVVSPLFFKRNINALKRANRNLSRKVKGSNHFKRAKLALARLHKKVHNQRSNFHWQLANKLCGEYATICIEDLNLKGMQRLYGRKIGDLGFAEFVDILEYKACRAGTRLVKVDRYFASSQTCSECGHKNHELKDLRIRSWQCKKCGAMHDRDRNAAINILNEGMKMVA